jgi:RNA polymerase sigma-70 factor (ECF subfamily)
VDDKRRRFEAQVLPYLDAAYNLARWLARSPADADDIVQEAVLRAYRGFEGFRGEDG